MGAMTQSQSAVNWHNTHTHVDRMHSFTHLHQHSYNHVVRSASSAITEFGIKFYFEGIWGKGSKLEYPEKTPDSLPANRYHILEKKIQRPEWESNPHPPTMVIRSFGQERVPRLTH